MDIFMEEKIKEKFSAVENSDKDNLPAEVVFKLFRELRELIDELEGEDSAKHLLYRYKYHLEKTSYLRAIGKIEEANKEEKLLSRYQLIPSSEKTRIIDSQSIFSNQPSVSNAVNSPVSETTAGTYAKTTTNTSDPDSFGESVHFQNLSAQCLKALEVYLDERYVKELSLLFNQLFQQTISSLEQNLVFKQTISQIQALLEQVEESLLLADEKNVDTSIEGQREDCFSLIKLCKAHLVSHQYEQQAAFGQFLITPREKKKEEEKETLNLEDILFKDVVLTEERVTKVYKQWALLFHPDQVFIPPEHKFLFTEVFKHVVDKKEKILAEIGKKSINTEKYLKKGNELYDLALDCNFASKKEFKRLKVKQESDFQNMTELELKNLKIQYALLAYEQYRAAANTIKEGSDLKTQARLRYYMALALYLGEDKINAEVYAIGAIYILTERCAELNLNDVQELRALLGKIHATSIAVNATTQQQVLVPTAAPQQSHQSSLSNALVALSPESKKLALAEKRKINHGIKEDLGALVLSKFMLKGNKQIVRYQTSESTITEAQLKANSYRLAGRVLKGVAYTTGGAIIAINAMGFAGVAMGLVGAATLWPVGIAFGLLQGGVSIAAGSYFSWSMFKKSNDLLQEPTIRTRLNQAIQLALIHYDEKRYDDFFELLSRPYIMEEELYQQQDKCLLEFKRGDSIRIHEDKFVQRLLSHGFRPEGIAYLLNLMADALLSGSLRFKGQAQSSLIELAIRLFLEVHKNTALEEQAKKFDDQVKNSRFQTMSTENWFQRGWNYLHAKFSTVWATEYYSIPKEYLEDSQVAPFTARLEEMRNIARINYAIAQILAGGTDNLTLSREFIQEVKKSLSQKFQFFSLSAVRIQALDDLLFALGYPEKEEVHSNLLALESSLLFNNVKKVLFDKHYLHCETLLSITEEEDQLGLLDRLLDGSLAMNKPKFIERIHAAMETDASFVAIMQSTLKAAQLSDINQWCNKFLAQRQVLNAAFLPIFSKLLKLNFQFCAIGDHPEHGKMFIPIGEMISQGTALTRCIYLALNEAKEVAAVFVAVDKIQLNFLCGQLQLSSDLNVKTNLYKQIGKHYSTQAKSLDRHHLRALPIWQQAFKAFKEAINLKPGDTEACLSYANCLLMLNKYDQVRLFLYPRRNLLENIPQYWLLFAIANRKLHRYDHATYAIKQALEKAPNDKNVIQESKIINSLVSKRSLKEIKNYKVENEGVVRPKETANYNILSLDGGGIRGILATVWLSEMERLTHRSMASLFHMMAGTSTGAIIAAGLSMPKTAQSKQPRYLASEILEIYRTQGKNIFTRPGFGLPNFSGMAKPKYTAQGREALFSNSFGTATISEALTELVIPAVRSGSNGTSLFTRQSALYDPSKNMGIVNILMATSAAPTYFPPHIIGDYAYVDGGVQANNPVTLAYTEALKNNIDLKDIYIWSLGTGDYVPDSLYPEKYRNLLFWAGNGETVSKIIFDGPQNNLDLTMRATLGNRYQRWQMWFEKPIGLDDVRQETLDTLVDSGIAYFEEMQADDSNQVNVLIEHLMGEPKSSGSSPLHESPLQNSGNSFTGQHDYTAAGLMNEFGFYGTSSSVNEANEAPQTTADPLRTNINTNT